MFLKQVYFSFLLLHLVHSHLQINLHRTDWVREDVQHHCLRVPAHVINESDPRQIISYCMTELPSKFLVKVNNGDQNFTFEQLAKQKITNQQLYLWSAPIDLIEQYQSYLNQIDQSQKSFLGSQIFYNCTMPYFGPQCQYALADHQSYHSSLDEIVHDYYRYNTYEPTLLTCYVHLECNRGPSPSCLDWREICDGKRDCLDDASDEEHCWQLEIQDYNGEEYPMSNRRCISEAFFRDDSNIPDCVGESTVVKGADPNHRLPPVEDPTFRQEDISCKKYNNRRRIIEIRHETCSGTRTEISLQAMLSIKPKWLPDECWSAVSCKIVFTYRVDSTYSKICRSTFVNEIISKTCPNITYAPAVPVLLGHIYLAYDKSDLLAQYHYNLARPTYFCYDDQLLRLPDDDQKKILLNNNTCHLYDRIGDPSLKRMFTLLRLYIIPLYYWLHLKTIPIDKNFHLIHQSMMYKCINWPKYISKSRLFDSVQDCYYSDDERIWNKTCPTESNVNLFKCPTTARCIPKHLLNNGFCDCTDDNLGPCDDEYSDISYSLTTISFQTICDNYPNLSPNLIEDFNQTDETNCEHWPLIHVYNRCDGFWDRLDGSDEVNCDPSPLLNCSFNHHICVSPATYELMCLPMEKVSDGIIDCLGAADEPTLCQDHLKGNYPLTFYCRQNGFIPCVAFREICDNEIYCDNDIDEQACKSQDLVGVSLFKGVCKRNYESDGSDVAKVLCRRFSFTYYRLDVYFTLDQWQDMIKRRQTQNNSLSNQSPKQNIQSYQPRCHRGLNLQVWLDKEKNLTKNICLCPPSYYGDICQYQNQRVSLTLQFTVASDSVQTPFNIIASLIDESDERIIHSFEQFTYLPMENCRRRYDVYLLYSTRPKDQMKNYSIQIDIYEKQTLDYRASFIKSLNYSFLPVHRVALQLDIPPIMNNLDDCLDTRCDHGECQKYFNHRHNRTFCKCQSEWSGRFCSIPYTSTCSSDALSIGRLANNQSLCLCPMNKIGPRCFIDDEICQNTKCLNEGKCISVDEYQTSKKKFVCICSKGYTGDRCEIARTKLIMTFHQNITLPSLIYIHFIEVKLDASPIRSTTFKATSFARDSMTVYWSLPFHIIILEFLNESYYLTHVQKIYNQSATIEKTLKSDDRCLDIKELFNESIANSSLLHRIKYYHIPCQTHSSQLKCFYDERHFCLCQQVAQQYVSNCFEFKHQMNLTCSGKSVCENEGECFQEQTLCPRVALCRCPPCYYGSQCQLSSNGFSLSLDAILGFHIRPNLPISHQPSAVSISLTLTVLITLCGLANGFLSLITFRNKITRESGCGLYLLLSSVMVLLTMIIFLLKFIILLLSQMGSITNQSFLTIQCHSIDFLLRFSLTMDQWLTAFVAIERATIIIKGTNFNKKKSKLTAKRIIAGLVLMAIVTNIHDPIYRRLFVENDDDDEKRLWCIVKYTSAIRIINITINILHFIVPFIINFISSLIIIIISTRQEAAKKKKKKKYREILNEQLQQHKNLLIGPCVLIILAIPRLIISFTSGCMKSGSDSWLFLLGYFISLIPPLLTFILFVLPSTTYRQAFRKAISRYRNIVRRRP